MFSAKTLTGSQINGFIISYNDNKATLGSIAKEIGCSVPTAGRILKANGAQMRAKGRPKGSKTVNRKKKVSIADTQLKLTATPEVVAENPPRATEDFVSFQQRIMAGVQA